MKNGSEIREIKNIKDPVQGRNKQVFREIKKSRRFGKIKVKLNRYDN